MIRKRKIRKAFKRAVVMCLSAATMLGCMTGCSGSSGSGSSSSSEPITLTVFSERANYSGEQEGWSAQILKDKFNVILNIVPNTDGAFDTRMEAGNLGDIVVFGSEKDYQKAQQAGLLFDWEEDDILSDYGSDIQENMHYALEKNRSMNSDDKIYGLGYEVATSSTDLQSFFYTWDIRWDLYKELGYPEVNDLDDMVELFKQMKEICPTDDAGNPTYAVSMWPDWDGDMVMYVKSTATAYYGYDEFGVGLYNPTTGEFIGALDDDSPYIEMIKFYNKLYQNDLVDPDSMTATYDTAIEKVKKGGTFFSIFNYSGYLAYNTETHTSENKMMKSLVPTEATPIVYGMNVLGGNNYWSIGAKTEYPELCMEIIDYLCTPEGRMTFEYGPQGVTWDYDEDGNTYFTELGQKTNNDKSTQMEAPYSGTYKDGELQINCITWSIDASNPDSNGETYNDEDWKSNQTEAVCDTDQDWRDYTGCTTINEYMSKGNYRVSPGSAYVAGDKSDELKTTWAQVTNCITDYTWKAIYAESDEECEEIIEEMIEKANDYGYQDCWDWSNDEAAIRKAAEDAVSD
jgi:multiple sugar transport system substrate-binding protein/putative aldouronate transport system substrate-binding protein